MVNSALRSMTGYATRDGGLAPWTWVWELRAVNARGLDLKLRLVDWVPGLEPAVRAKLSAAAKRGNLSVSLRMARGTGAEATLNEAALAAVLTQVAHVTNAARAAGLETAPPTALALLSSGGVMEANPEDPRALEALQTALLADLDRAIVTFSAARAAEGAALHGVLSKQLTQIARLTDQAAEQAQARRQSGAARLKEQVAALLEAAGEGAPDPQRLAQELALLAVKGDVTEEIDRLKAHVAAAKGLLTQADPVGRRLDFLCQEFNREANTLCSKSQDTALTGLGLELKVLIEQMREQVQNIE